MEAIDKAKIAEFAEKVKAQADQNSKAIAELQAQTFRMQGATAALDYILAIETITLTDEDEVTPGDWDLTIEPPLPGEDDLTDKDIEDVIGYLETHADEVYAEGAPV